MGDFVAGHKRYFIPKTSCRCHKFYGILYSSNSHHSCTGFEKRRHLHGVWRVLLIPKGQRSNSILRHSEGSPKLSLEVELSGLEKPYFCVSSCKNTADTIYSIYTIIRSHNVSSREEEHTIQFMGDYSIVHSPTNILIRQFRELHFKKLY
jgi:hypothetical protein